MASGLLERRSQRLPGQRIIGRQAQLLTESGGRTLKISQ